MVGSRDLPPSDLSFGKVFYNNQFPVQLLNLGLSHLVLAVRSTKRGEDAVIRLRKKYPEAYLQVWELDMSSYESVQGFVKRVDSHLSCLDFVLLNAGIAKLNFHRVGSTGHEETIQVNYLSTVLLTILLLPILKSKRSPGSEPSHLTIVNAALTLAAKFPNKDADPLLPSFDDPKSFHPQETYNSSKLLAHMFLWKLVDHVSSDDVIVNLADPGWCRGTELGRDATGLMRIFMLLFGMTGRAPRVGASCFVDALVNKGKDSHGCFLMSWNIHPFSAFLYTPKGKGVTDKVWSETLAELDFAGGADQAGFRDALKAARSMSCTREHWELFSTRYRGNLSGEEIAPAFSDVGRVYPTQRSGRSTQF
ncbi:hypothetical protein DL768_010835 [Monosporascus sp. mg162]|nr:hypothetical protein DL768_010835 [Monosporascus sp. mg162]